MAPVADEVVERDKFRDWPAIGRWAVYLTLALVLILVVGSLAGVVVVRQSFQTTEGQLSVVGLQAKVDVLRDQHGIPQIYADTSEDLFFAQGYVSAQDRFFQMDLRRHLTEGRLSEMVGEPGLRTDQFMRVMGWHRVAEQEVALLDPLTKAALQSYADGVNAWLHERTPSSMSLEYTALSVAVGDYRPEDWSIVDSLAWLKALAWDLSGNADDEITRSRLALTLPPERLAELYPPYPYDSTPRVAVEIRAVANPGAQTVMGEVQNVLAQMPHPAGVGDGIGSNAWVVSGDNTTGGAPLLANDPHLSVSLPGTFWQVGLHCRTVSEACPYDVAGFGMAGFPGVVIGRNAQISWGITNVHADLVDLYLEKVTDQTYLVGKKWVPLIKRTETIKVAGGRSRKLTVRATEHGPLLSDVSRQWSTAGANAQVPEGSPERANGYAVALNWTALRPGRTADALLGVDRAADWAQFRAASSHLEAPALNLLYADVSGNIGAEVVGRIPIRAALHSGDVPAAGWRKDQQPTGRSIPFTQLPASFNPPSGLIVSANQPAAGPDYPYRITDRPDYGFRARRIAGILGARIKESAPLRVQDMSAVQSDTLNPLAPVLVPYLLDISLETAYDRGGQQLLEDWDYNQPVDSAAAAYFNVVWSNLLRLTFDDELPASARPDGGSRWMFVMTQLLRQPASRWWDDVDTPDRVENRDDILAQAMLDARDEMVRRQARDPQDWTWGHLHRLRLSSQVFGSSRIGRMVFDRSEAGAPGSSAAVNATAWDARAGYAVTTGPVFRMVVDLAQPDRSRWVNLAGESGHAFAGTYVDQREEWLSGESPDWPWSRSAIEAATQQRLTLLPPVRSG